MGERVGGVRLIEKKTKGVKSVEAIYKKRAQSMGVERAVSIKKNARSSRKQSLYNIFRKSVSVRAHHGENGCYEINNLNK